MAMASDIPLLLLLFSPLLAAVASLVEKLLVSRHSSLKAISAAAFMLWLGGSAAGLIISAPAVLQGESLSYVLGGWREPFGISLELTGLTWVATLTDVLIAVAVWFHSRRGDDHRQEFSFFLFMALFSLQGILYTEDLFNLFVWFEVLSLSSFLLIVQHRSREAYEAAFRYLLISTVSIIFFLFGIWILYRHTGGLSLSHIGSVIGGLEQGERGELSLAAACITAGILTRAAILPFHTWLPGAHAAAPYPISALLSGFVIKAPVLALWRIYSYVPALAYGEILVWIGAACALFGVIAAMAQRDAKRLLGYHSVSQMGYIVAAFGFGGAVGRAAALLYIVAHALFKSILFISIGRVTERGGSRDVYRLRGMGRLLPGYSLLYAVAALSITGVPLFAGYTAKLLVSEALHYHPSYLLLTLAGVGTAASFFKLSTVFLGTPVYPAGTRSAPPAGAAPPAETAPPAGAALPARAALPREYSRPGIPDAGAGATEAAAFLSTAVLAAGCILLGLLPEASRTAFFLIASGDAGEGAVQWYGLSTLLKTALSLAAGFLLSRVLLAPWGKRLSSSLRDLGLGLNGSLRLLMLGFLIFLLYSLREIYPLMVSDVLGA
jgi:multicomponent Na+:H+ antiporter subunit D